MRIIVFGDSIAEGFWDYESGGWVNRLKVYFWKKYGYEKMVFNAGISAYTSINILNYFKPVFNAISRREVGKEKDTTVIFAFGINDSAEFIDTGDKRVTSDNFQNNLEQLMQMCQKEILIKHVIFLSAINVEEDVINQEDSIGAEHFFYNSEIRRYNHIIQEVAQKYNQSYIHVFGLMQEGDLEDGLHPSSQGHQKIYEKVLEYLET